MAWFVWYSLADTHLLNASKRKTRSESDSRANQVIGRKGQTSQISRRCFEEYPGGAEKPEHHEESSLRRLRLRSRCEEIVLNTQPPDSIVNSENVTIPSFCGAYTICEGEKISPSAKEQCPDEAAAASRQPG